MQTLQELEVWFVLPGIRRELARTLKDAGYPQKRIAELLQLTESAVSQYLSGKRGADISFPSDFLKKIAESASQIASGAHLQSEVQHLLRISEKHHSACIPCPVKKSNPSCEICYP